MKRIGSISADPNPIEAADYSGCGITTLSWTCIGVQEVEVHVDAPDGPLFSRTGPAGHATTGKWVRDGMAFYLQDVSEGRPLNVANTLATATVNLSWAVYMGLCLADSLNGDAIAAVIQRQLGEHPRLGPLRVRPSMTLVCDAYLPESTVVFKAALDEAGSTLALEGWVCERVRQLGVPSPQVIALDTSRQLLPRPYLIMEKLPGRPLNQLQLAPDKLRPLVKQVGHYVRLMHSVQLEGFGYLDEELYLSEGRIRGECETWRDAVLQEHTQDVAYLEQHGLLDRHTTASVRTVLERYEDLLGGCEVGCLLHGDVSLLHIFADPQTGKVTGIIDFADRRSGDPAWDLSQFALQAGTDNLDYLLEGYRPDDIIRKTLPVKIALYRLLSVISAARWAHQRVRIKEMPGYWRSYLDEALQLGREQG